LVGVDWEYVVEEFLKGVGELYGRNTELQRRLLLTQ
jgi:hypothetical protein